MRFSVRTGSYFGMWTAVFMLAKAEDNLSTDKEIIESPVYIPIPEEALHEKRFKLRRVSVQKLDFTTEDTILNLNKMVPVHTQQESQPICELIPGPLSMYLCKTYPLYEELCPDNCIIDPNGCEDECAADDGRFKCAKPSCSGCSFCAPTIAPTDQPTTSPTTAVPSTSSSPTAQPTEQCKEECAEDDSRFKCAKPSCGGCSFCAPTIAPTGQPTTSPTTAVPSTSSSPTAQPTEQCKDECADDDSRFKCKKPSCSGCPSCKT